MEAVICFERATEVAQLQSDRWWELDAKTSLARLLFQQQLTAQAMRCPFTVAITVTLGDR